MHEDTVKDNIPDERVCKEEIEKAVKLNRIHFNSLHVVCLPISEGTEIDLKKEIKLCSDNAFPFEFEVNDRHKMEITAKGSVKGEKFFEVKMVGFLSFESDIKIKQEEKLDIVNNG